MNPIKKVLAIHDLSCYGRASLTSIIPIMSVLGVQVCPLPTAVLSTHTGGYGKPYIEDLNDFMVGGTEHFHKLNLKFNSIYTGYLASREQINSIINIIDTFKMNDQIILIDPVMADDGVLYSGFNQEIVDGMRSLIQKSTIITPNVTEAAFLLNANYQDRFNFDIVDTWAKELSKLANSDVIITSCESKQGEKFIDTIIYNKEDKKLSRVSVKKINKYFPGTGDAFASVLLSKVINGEKIEKAASFASEFVSKSVNLSSKYEYQSKEGILLEKALLYLFDQNKLV
ncbi:MAG: pyridoxamine kinase [Sarcina sp.]